MKNCFKYLPSLLSIFLLTYCSGLFAAEPVVLLQGEKGKIIDQLSFAKTSFNPSIGRKLALQVGLQKPADVTIRVFDPDWNEIRVLTEATSMKKGKNLVKWDGKDRDGNIVPDEAYYFTLEAKSSDGKIEVYDPTAFSGGIEEDLTQASIDKLAGTIKYRLPQMSRVDVRIGVSGGPLLRKLVDWEPRPAGEIAEYWDGKDKDKLFDLHEHQKSKMIITYITLPDNSVITYGNKKISFPEYIQGKDWPNKVDRTTDWAKDKKISHHYRIPRAKDSSPKISMAFPNQVATEDGIPVLKGRSVVNVELDAKSKKFFEDSKFEIVFFLDGTFHAEEETGYAPYNWVWDTAQTKEGTYVLTVNVSSFKDQIGIVSKKVKIVH